MLHKSLKFLNFILVSVSCLTSCAKRSLQPLAPTAVYTPVVNSSVRIIQLSPYGVYDLAINGQRLTNFIPSLLSNASNNPAAIEPTLYFPVNGKFSGIFTIPNSLFVNNKAHVVIGNYALYNQKDSFVVVVDTVLQSSPADLYVGYSNAYIIPRDVFSSGTPSHCKIRLVNLFDQGTGSALPMTLTWSDGSPIDAASSHIPINGGTGNYIDMPYTTCRLHVFDDNGRPLAESLPTSDINDYKNTFDLLDPYSNDSIVSLVHTLQPGGNYTVIVNPTTGRFQLVADNNPVNNSFGRIQFVNAVAGFSPVEFRVDNKTIQSMGFGDHCDYGIYNRGPHLVSAVYSGKVLVQQTIVLQPGDALTLWAYHNDSTYDLLYTNTDMSVSVNFNNTNNLSRTLTLPEAVQVRFLNLCPDIPYATFTNNGQLIPPFVSYFANTLLSAPKSSDTIPFAQILPDSPYIRITAESSIPKSIAVYQPAIDSPETLPGVPVSGVSDLQSPFLGNPAMYNGHPPPGEYGLYSVALIGRATIDTSGLEKLKLIVVKHNK